MAKFSIRLAKRDIKGKPIQNKFVELETNSASELADFYNRTAAALLGKRHNAVLAKKTVKKNKKAKDGAKNIPVSRGTASE